MSEWMSVEDGLPNHRDCLVWIQCFDDEISGIDIGRYSIEDDAWAIYDETFREYDTEINKVTHWMPLPEPPERIKDSDDE